MEGSFAVLNIALEKGCYNTGYSYLVAHPIQILTPLNRS